MPLKLRRNDRVGTKKKCFFFLNLCYDNIILFDIIHYLPYFYMHFTVTPRLQTKITHVLSFSIILDI